MKIGKILLFVVTYLCFTDIGWAENEWTVEKIHRHFSYSYSPKEVFLTARKAAFWFSEECKKSDDQCLKALAEFNKPQSDYISKEWIFNGYHPHFTTINCSANRVVGHQNPALHRIVNNPKIDIRQMKDRAGFLFGVHACQIVKENPDGAFLGHMTTWDKSVTKLNDTFFSLNVVIKVKGTPYQLFTNMPFQIDSKRTKEEVLDDLNLLLKGW